MALDPLVPSDPFPTTKGRVVPFRDTCKDDEELRRYSGEDVELELPADISLADIGYLSVWCISQKAEFGGIAIDTRVLDPIPTLEDATCRRRGQKETTNAIPVRDGWNCERLTGDYQVRWHFANNRTAVKFELVARLRNGGQWMGFGISGSDERTLMIGSDATIAYRRGEDFFAIDYHLEAQMPCNPPNGICPDTFPNQTDGINDVTEVSGEVVDDLTVVRYSRPVKGSDPDLDKDINLYGACFVVWAFGPLNINMVELFPLYHLDPLSRPNEDVSIEFGREPVNNCERGLVRFRRDHL